MDAKELTLLAMKNSDCDSQNQLAKKLDVHSEYVSGWISGRRKPDATYIGMLAELAGLDPWETMKDYEIKNEAHPGRKRLWEHLARAAVLLAVVSSFFVSPSPAEASSSAASGPNRCILC